MRSRASASKKAFAKHLRQNQTWPEKTLGHALSSKFVNIPIYRQSICYGYILDFYVKANKETAPYKGLAIEVDGPHHLKQKDYDNNRDRVLWSKGIKTLRFDMGSIYKNLPAVLAIIASELIKIRT